MSSENDERQAHADYWDTVQKEAQQRRAEADARRRDWLAQKVLADHVVIRNGDDHETEQDVTDRLPYGSLGWIRRSQVAEVLTTFYTDCHLRDDDVLMVLDEDNRCLGEAQADGRVFLGGDGQPWTCFSSPDEE